VLLVSVGWVLVVCVWRIGLAPVLGPLSRPAMCLCGVQDARSISIQQGVCFQKLTLFGKSLQLVQTTWQQVRTMSKSLEYSRVPFEREKDLAKTVRTLGQAVRT
jgi:hypothetical protein